MRDKPMAPPPWSCYHESGVECSLPSIPRVLSHIQGAHTHTTTCWSNTHTHMQPHVGLILMQPYASLTYCLIFSSCLKGIKLQVGLVHPWTNATRTTLSERFLYLQYVGQSKYSVATETFQLVNHEKVTRYIVRRTGQIIQEISHQSNGTKS
jgi:hypothetical protein